MKHNVYFDVLDTHRTAFTMELHERKQAQEWIRLGQAELMMSVLRGWIPVLPQTSGWDSTALLSYASENGRDGESFKWLLSHGFIRIRLRGHATVWDAALEAFHSPKYDRLSAWPEFNTHAPLEARRPLVEAMRTGKCPAALPQSVRERLQVLRELSEAAARAPAEKKEKARGTKLSTLIARTARAAQDVDLRVANILQQCTQIRDPNNRTALLEFLDGYQEDTESGVSEALDVINCCFNSVAADCLEAEYGGLTTPRSHHGLSVQVLLRALPGARRTDVFEGHSATLNARDLSDLEVVHWSKVKDFLGDSVNLTLKERDREAEAAKLIAELAVQGVRRYVLVPKAVDVIGAALWGAVGAAVAGAFGGATAPIIASGIAGGLGILGASNAARTRLAARVTKKWEGVLQAAQRRITPDEGAAVH